MGLIEYEKVIGRDCRLILLSPVTSRGGTWRVGGLCVGPDHGQDEPPDPGCGRRGRGQHWTKAGMRAGAWWISGTVWPDVIQTFSSFFAYVFPQNSQRKTVAVSDICPYLPGVLGANGAVGGQQGLWAQLRISGCRRGVGDR